MENTEAVLPPGVVLAPVRPLEPGDVVALKSGGNLRMVVDNLTEHRGVACAVVLYAGAGETGVFGMVSIGPRLTREVVDVRCLVKVS